MSQQNKDRANWVGICLLIIGLIYANKLYHWNLWSFPWDMSEFHWYLRDHNWNLFGLDWHITAMFFSWQFMLIVIGLLLVIMGRGAGTIFILIGAFFLFTDEFIWAIGNIDDWWPLILILIGVSMLARAGTNKKTSKQQ